MFYSFMIFFTKPDGWQDQKEKCDKEQMEKKLFENVHQSIEYM